MPSPKDDIFTEISKDFNIRWNFPNCIESIDASNQNLLLAKLRQPIIQLQTVPFHCSAGYCGGKS
jgi:hypothetical protein